MSNLVILVYNKKLRSYPKKTILDCGDLVATDNFF